MMLALQNFKLESDFRVLLGYFRMHLNCQLLWTESDDRGKRTATLVNNTTARWMIKSVIQPVANVLLNQKVKKPKNFLDFIY